MIKFKDRSKLYFFLKEVMSSFMRKLNLGYGLTATAGTRFCR